MELNERHGARTPSYVVFLLDPHFLCPFEWKNGSQNFVLNTSGSHLTSLFNGLLTPPHPEKLKIRCVIPHVPLCLHIVVLKLVQRQLHLHRPTMTLNFIQEFPKFAFLSNTITYLITYSMEQSFFLFVNNMG